MRAETHKVYLVCLRIKPDKQKIALDMTFHISLIVTGQHVRIMLFRNRLFIGELIKDILELCDLLGVISESLVVFLVLR